MNINVKKLLLTSAAFSNPKIGEEFLRLIPKKPSEVKVLFIPTASEYKLENDPTSAFGRTESAFGETKSAKGFGEAKDEMFYVKESEKELIGLGIPKENIFWLDIKNIPAAGDVNSYDVMYVCGGNTFYLMHQFKNTGFDKKVIEFTNSGKVYVGVSAGSVIAGPDISIASPFDPNDVGLKDTKGLCVTDAIICPHYQRKEESIISEFEKENNCKILRLTDNQALEVLGGVSKIIE